MSESPGRRSCLPTQAKIQPEIAAEDIFSHPYWRLWCSNVNVLTKHCHDEHDSLSRRSRLMFLVGNQSDSLTAEYLGRKWSLQPWSRRGASLSAISTKWCPSPVLFSSLHCQPGGLCLWKPNRHVKPLVSYGCKCTLCSVIPWTYLSAGLGTL